MGDLLQSSPMLAGLKEKYPDSEFTLLVQENFRRICSGFTSVDRVLSFDVQDYIYRLEDEHKSLYDNYLRLRRFIKRAGSEYDLIINLSHTSLSGIIASLIGAKEIRGMMMTEKGKHVVRHPWMEYFFYVTAHRRYNTFNLVDMYNRTGEINSQPRKLIFTVPDEIKEFAEQIFSGRKNKVIGFQLGASTDKRRWPPELFGKLAGLIREKFGWDIMVFGAASEQGYLAKMQENYSGPIIDMTGQTTIPQLAALLERCSFLITNDTGTMHLAAAVGTPTVAIFLGEARSSDTGPYTEKAIILEPNIDCAPCEYNTECENFDCLRYISPEDVLFAVENFSELTDGKIEQIKDDLRWEKVNIYRPLFDDDGFLETVPLIRRPITFEELLKTMYRRMWKMYLNAGDYNKDETLNYYLPPEEERFEANLHEFTDLMTGIASLSAKGQKWVSQLLTAIQKVPRDERQLFFLSKLMTLMDGTLWQYEWNYEETRPITKFIRLLTKNLESNTPEAVINLANNIYSTAQSNAEFLQSLLAEYKVESN